MTSIELMKPGEFWRRHRRELPFGSYRALRYHLDRRTKNGLLECGGVVQSPIGLLIDPEQFLTIWLRGHAEIARDHGCQLVRGTNEFRRRCDLHSADKAEVERLRGLLARCLPIIEADARMMADITRHSPLDAESQAIHDSTEYESEKLLREIPAALAGTADQQSGAQE